MSSYDATFKIVLLGDSVSKTTFIYKYLTNIYDESIHMTIGADFSWKALEIDGKRVKLQIWDFSVGQRFKVLLPRFVKGADGALFIYDIANYASINNIDDWLNMIRKEDRAEIPILLVGIMSNEKNKLQVSVEDGKEIAKLKKLNGFIECNVRTGENVDKAFEALTRLVLANKDSHPPPKPPLHSPSPPKPQEVTRIIRRPPDIELNQDQITNILSVIERYWQLQNSRVIAVTLVQEKDKLIYSTDNEDISVDVGKVISSWSSMKAQFIMVSGVKYKVILNTPGLLIFNSKGDKDYIIVAKNRDYTFILRVEHDSESTLKETRNGAKRLFESLSHQLSKLSNGLRASAPLKGEDHEKEIHCQYCGRKLTKEEQFTHSCNRFFLG